MQIEHSTKLLQDETDLALEGLLRKCVRNSIRLHVPRQSSAPSKCSTQEARFSNFPKFLPRLTPHRDNGARHRSRSVLRRFEQLLRGAARDSVRVTCAQGVSPPPPAGPAFLRTSRRRHLRAQPQGNCSTHQK